MTAGGAGTPVLDVVGIGFGPSNLALAIALDEHNRGAAGSGAAGGPGRPVSAVFLERQPRFGWHRGMLIDDATMQVSFLKDLVTLRNPASDFSFVAYLHARERLVDFINHKTLFPLRIEFHDYMEWAAERLAHLTAYGQEATDVRPVTEGGTVVAFDVVARDPEGGVTVRRARNVVVAAGLTPRVPEGVRLGSRVWHNADILRRVEALPADPPPRRFVVVGAGQSAAEVVDFLHRRYAGAEVCSVFARYGYTPADDTPFANRIFDPEAVDVYYGADDGVKRMLFDYHRNTNYSVVDQDLINELYRRAYQEKVQGRERLRMLNASRVADVQPTAGGVRVEVEHLPTRQCTALAADALVYATGYQPTDVVRLLGAAGRLARRHPDGSPQVARDYRLATTTPTRGGIYLHGGTEHTHGLTATLLSNVAVRAGEITHAITSRLGAGSDPDPGGNGTEVVAERVPAVAGLEER